ncbi:MAG: hypothetical protein R2856_27825 [Caldilineaceae bacterium]
MTHSTLISNTAGYRGGALNGQGNTVFTLIASQVLSNTAAGGGGIAAGHNTNTTLMDSVVAYNNSTGSGGGIHNLADTVTIDHSAIYRNSATNLGGAIYNGSGGVADVINSTLSSNTANGGDSAIFQSYGLTTTLVARRLPITVVTMVLCSSAAAPWCSAIQSLPTAGQTVPLRTAER